MTGHVVRMRHVSKGFHHWQARCTCGWREWCTSEVDVRDRSEAHAFDHKGSVEATVQS